MTANLNSRSNRLRNVHWCCAIMFSVLLAQSAAGATETAPKFAWAVAGSGNIINPWSDIDSAGNTYVVASWDYSLSGTNGTNGFFAKYNPHGQLVWLKSDWGYYARPEKVAVDGQDNVYVEFWLVQSPVTISGLVATGNSALAKYDPDGRLIWIRSLLPDPFDTTTLHPALWLNADRQGNCYYSVAFYGHVNLGETNITATASGYRTALAKYDPQGHFCWAITVRGTGQMFFTDCAVDLSGNVYVAGSFTGLADFAYTNLTAAGIRNFFLSKYSSDGSLQWARQTGADNAGATRLVGDGNGNCLITGYFSNTTQFGSTVLTNGDTNWHYFVLRCDNNGTPIWAHDIGHGSARITPTLDKAGNIYVGTDGLAASTAYIKYAENGSLIWQKQITNGPPPVYSMCADEVGNLYMAGMISGSGVYNFDDLVITNARMFIAKLRTSNPPNLNIERGPDAIKLSWSALYPEHYLESAPLNFPGAGWTKETITSTREGLSDIVLYPPSSEPMIFRLQGP